ncbi:hypothetical protein F8M41_021409 [Gigaspora margarita]|uniref:Cytochrome P450 n=1 Tax=Gigaspora margarita TaxID=4874 RepID=A0A8H4AGY3_GIGMA|nr:hypothetical protein F8M41_021409 [Gigaspora margarita]
MASQLCKFYEGALLLSNAIFSIFSIVTSQLFKPYELYLVHFSKACRWFNDRGEDIPGPPPKLPEGDRYTRMTDDLNLNNKYYEKYGDLYRIWNGSIPELVLARPEDIAVFYKDGLSHDLQDMNTGHFFYKIIGESVGFAVGSTWKNMRDLLHPYFNNKAAIQFMPMMIRNISGWLKSIPFDKNTLKVEEGYKFPLSETIKSLPLLIISHVLYNDCMTEEDLIRVNEITINHEKLMEIVFCETLPRFSWYSIFPTSQNKLMNQMLRDWKTFCFDMNEKTIKDGKSNPAYKLYKDVEEGKWTLSQYLQTIYVILLSNIDFSCAALSWQLIGLAQWSRVQEKLRKEVQSILAVCPKGFDDENFNNYICKKNTYLHYVCLENFRMFPVLAYTLPEFLAEDKIIRGHRIPKRTFVSIDTWTLHTKAAVWGNDSNKYHPERFEKLKPEQYRHALWRFGLGPRRCLGYFYAERMLKAIMALIVHSYEIKIPNDCEVKLHSRTLVRIPNIDFVFKPIE